MTKTGTADDWDLFYEWRSGSSEAGDRLLTRHFEMLTRFFYNKVQAEDVGDLVADTYLACVSSIDRLEPSGAFKSLLFGIAMNKLRNYYRRQVKRRRECEDFDMVCAAESGLATPSTVVAQREEVRVLVRALRRLPLAHQTVVELNFFEGLRGPEIAELLGLPVATVYTQLRRGRTRLNDLVRDLSENPRLAETTMMGLETWALQIRAQIPGH